VLTALANGPRHGYGIVGEVAELSGARVKLKTGSLYGVLERLAAGGLIEADRRPGAPLPAGAAYPQPPAYRDQQPSPEPDIRQVEGRTVEPDVKPVHDAAVHDGRRPKQAVDQVASGAGCRQRGTESFSMVASPHCPRSEQDHAGESNSDEERLVACAQAEGSAVIDDKLKANQSSGHRDIAPAGESG
jgi:hypothetical protein